MPLTNQTEARISLRSVLRCVGICVAIGEMAYLVAWMVLTLTPATGARRTETLNGLLDLGAGMVWAALFGTIVGLTTTLTFNLIGRRAVVRARTRD